MSKEELGNRMKKGLCRRCSGSSHFVAKCPYLPARNPGGNGNGSYGRSAGRQQINNVVVPPKLEEEETENGDGVAEDDLGKGQPSN